MNANTQSFASAILAADTAALVTALESGNFDALEDALSTAARVKLFGNKFVPMYVYERIDGHAELVSIKDAGHIPEGTRIYSGPVVASTLKTGPYGSQVRTILTPCGDLDELVTCVVRVYDGLQQFVEVTDGVILTDGEKLFTGFMHRSMVKTGPSRSHSVTVFDPRGVITESIYHAPVATKLAA